MNDTEPKNGLWRGVGRALLIWTLASAIFVVVMAVGMKLQQFQDFDSRVGKQERAIATLPTREFLDYRLGLIERRLDGIEQQLKERRR